MGLDGFPSSSLAGETQRRDYEDGLSWALPKKGSAAAEPWELAAGTSENCVPAAIPHPLCRESWQWVLALLHRPQGSAQTRSCLVLPPSPVGEAVEVGSPSPG